MSDQRIVTIPMTHLNADEGYQARTDGVSELHVRLLAESNPED